MYTVTIGSSTFKFSDQDIDKLDIVSKNDSLHLLDNNRSIEAQLIDICLNDKLVRLKIDGKHFSVKIEDELDELVDQLGFKSEANLVIKDINAPMPGLVLEILVNEGDHIEKDSQLLILEAMKMENVIKSPSDGIVKKIKVSKGDAVEKNQFLISLD